MARIKETSQYRIYLQALEALRNRGYVVKQTKVKNSEAECCIYGNQKSADNFTDCYGKIFVVECPGTFERMIENITSSLWRTTITQWIDICKSVRDNNRKSKIYWPDDSFVGAYTLENSAYDFKYEDKWLNVVSSVF